MQGNTPTPYGNTPTGDPVSSTGNPVSSIFPEGSEVYAPIIICGLLLVAFAVMIFIYWKKKDEIVEGAESMFLISHRMFKMYSSGMEFIFLIASFGLSVYYYMKTYLFLSDELRFFGSLGIVLFFIGLAFSVFSNIFAIIRIRNLDLTSDEEKLREKASGFFKSAKKK